MLKKGIGMKKITAILALFTILVLYGMGPAPEQVCAEEVFTEIIVKTEPGIITMPEGQIEAEIGELKIDSESLDMLNEKYGLIGVKKIGPAGVDMPAEMADIYVFRFAESASMRALIMDYDRSPDVVYAEANAAVSIF